MGQVTPLQICSTKNIFKKQLHNCMHEIDIFSYCILKGEFINVISPPLHRQVC